MGVAIDPGYNFLQNLFNQGFAVADIDVVVVTHAHPDHVENLSNLLTLRHEREERLKKPSGIHLVVTEGVYLRFREYIDHQARLLRDVVVLAWEGSPGGKASMQDLVFYRKNRSGLDIQCALEGKRAGCGDREILRIRAIPAYHFDTTEHDSMGLVLEAGEARLGLTSDTRYRDDLCERGELHRCQVVVAHLGSVIRKEALDRVHSAVRVEAATIKDGLDDDLRETLRKEQHLYFPGMAKLVCDLAHGGEEGVEIPLVVLSEFGEELRGGLRMDAAGRIQEVSRCPVIPADVGLRIDVARREIRCAVCLRYVCRGEIDARAVADTDEALFYVCADCRSSREGELASILARLHSTPRPALTYDPDAQVSGS